MGGIPILLLFLDLISPKEAKYSSQYLVIIRRGYLLVEKANKLILKLGESLTLLIFSRFIYLRL